MRSPGMIGAWPVRSNARTAARTDSDSRLSGSTGFGCSVLLSGSDWISVAMTSGGGGFCREQPANAAMIEHQSATMKAVFRKIMVSLKATRSVAPMNRNTTVA